MKQQLIFTNNPGAELDVIVESLKPASVFVITDSQVDRNVVTHLEAVSNTVRTSEVIVCHEGDSNKNIETLEKIWAWLSIKGATRQSVIINVGGGMITDMGAFAAATFKRGVRFVNVPTTLLGAVDASVGGKTGINFNGLKNEVGVFAEAEASVISTVFFDTLPDHELLSGYAEMLKHALLKDQDSFVALLNFDPTRRPVDHHYFLSLLRESVDVKRRVVEIDPHEHGLRRALNLGHTVGHAFESYSLRRNRPISHGYAVAWGLLVELILSKMILGFPTGPLYSYSSFVRDNYGAFDIDCDDYPALLELMSHDKKNTTPDHINFSLLRKPGDIVIDCLVGEEDIKAALDIYRDMLGV